MPPSRKPGSKVSKSKPDKRGSSSDLSEDEKRRKFLEDSDDDSSDPDDPAPVSDRARNGTYESDRDPDDPDPVSDQGSISDFSDEEAAKPKKKKNDSSASDFSDSSSDDARKPSKKSPGRSKSGKKHRLKEDFLETSSDEETVSSKKSSKKLGGKKDDGKDKAAKSKTTAKKSYKVVDSSRKSKVDTMLEVSFDQYYKHKCKLAALSSAKTITGQDVCKPGKPAELSLDKLKLHYVVHFLYRGVWDHIVPEEEPGSEGRVECYICNICHKRFKNHLEKKEYPGRGSVLCHLATDHGLLLDVMKDEKEIDLSHDIQILVYNDKQFRDAYENGPDTSRMRINELVSVKESMLWRLQQQKKQADKKAAEAEKWKSDARNLFCEVSSKPLDPTATAEPPKPASNGLNTNKPSLLECPHCDEMTGNDDAPNLRLHIFHHYEEHWTERISKLAKGEKSFFCDRCPKKKKITGATMEGTRTAAVCHFAIQHYELRGVLEKDPKITPQFIKDLYWDHDHPSSSATTYYQSQAKLIKSQSPTKSARTSTKRKSAVSDDTDADSDDDVGDGDTTSEVSSLDLSESDLSDSDPNDETSSVETPVKKTTPVKAAKSGPAKTKPSSNGVSRDKSKLMPGELNPNYILKKTNTKTALTLDSGDDSASDHEWSAKKKKNDFGMSSAKKKRKLFNPKKDYDQVPKGRVMPVRRAAQQKVHSFLEEEEDDDD